MEELMRSIDKLNALNRAAVASQREALTAPLPVPASVQEDRIVTELFRMYNLPSDGSRP